MAWLSTSPTMRCEGRSIISLDLGLPFKMVADRNMLRIVLLSALAALSAAQRSSNPRDAAILAEERYLSVDGKFGAAYEQEDGVQFTEEADAEGNRRGSYSYVDPTGHRHTVNYVAGKNGFQPTGDHIPAIPAPVTNPLPQYNAPRQQQQAYSPPATQYGSQAEDDGQWVDDTRQDYPSSNPAPQRYTPPVTNPLR